MRLVSFTALAALAWAGVAGAQDTRPVLQPGEALLEVQAQGLHRSRPDVVTVTAGVVTTGRTAAEALAANSQQAERMLARIRALGVAADDVRTRSFSVQPDYADDRGRGEQRQIIGYTASNEVVLRLRNLAQAGAIVSAAFEAGANQVEGPSFSLADDRPAILAAQREAIRLAREEADNQAAALGMRVSRVLRVSERGGRVRREEGEAIVVTGSRIRAVPIEPGELETEADVWIDFALVPR